MEENLARAFKNLAGYTIKATEKAILELGESILDKKNESVKSHLEQRQKELERDLEIVRNHLEK
jgi:hypothetical protein